MAFSIRDPKWRFKRKHQSSFCQRIDLRVPGNEGNKETPAREDPSLEGLIAEAREEERRRIARELHDRTVQQILAVNLNLMSLKALLPASDSRVGELLAETMALGRECLQELRSIAYLLRPPLQEGDEFMPALYSYVDGFSKRSGIRINLVVPSHASRMPSHVENALFRVVQEALSNIHRHSQSASATIVLRKCAENVVLEVKDRGKGMPQAGGSLFWSPGGGLSGIEERMRELGGSLEVKAAHPGSGTVITATAPLPSISSNPTAAPD